MEAETICNLLEKLSEQQYKDVIRNFSLQNKRLRIPGFSHMEKAPLKLLANTARTNGVFRKALLRSISAVILSGNPVNLSQEISDIKKGIPHDQWLGLAAFLLLRDDDVCNDEAKIIIDEYAVTNQKDVQPNAEITPKVDKKEVKFREKYLKLRAEIAGLREVLEKQERQQREATAEIEQLRDEKKELEQRCITYLAHLDAIKKENSKLLDDLKMAQDKMAATQNVLQPKLDIHILAPNCEDILGRYSGTASIRFENTTNLSAAEALARYDEIWVFPDVVPFAAYRTLCKWKQLAEEKVLVFQTAADLVNYAEKRMRNI